MRGNPAESPDALTCVACSGTDASADHVAALLVANRIALPASIGVLRYVIRAAGGDPAAYLGAATPFVTHLTPPADHTLDTLFQRLTTTLSQLGGRPSCFVLTHRGFAIARVGQRRGVARR